MLIFLNPEAKSPVFFAIAMPPTFARPNFANEVKVSVTRPTYDSHESLNIYTLKLLYLYPAVVCSRIVLLLDYLGT